MSAQNQKIRDAIGKGLDAPRPLGLFSDTITNVLSAIAAAGYAVVERPALGVQPDDDAPGLYLRYRTGAERDAAASALAAAEEPKA